MILMRCASPLVFGNHCKDHLTANIYPKPCIYHLVKEEEEEEKKKGGETIIMVLIFLIVSLCESSQ